MHVKLHVARERTVHYTGAFRRVKVREKSWTNGFPIGSNGHSGLAMVSRRGKGFSYSKSIYSYVRLLLATTRLFEPLVCISLGKNVDNESGMLNVSTWFVA